MAAVPNSIWEKKRGAEGPSEVRLLGVNPSTGGVVLVNNAEHGSPFEITERELEDRYGAELWKPPTELERQAAQQAEQHEEVARTYFAQPGKREDVSRLKRIAEARGLDPHTPEEVFVGLATPEEIADAKSADAEVANGG